MARQRKYSPEFREKAVRLALESERPVAEVARSLDMHPETLRVWVRQHEREHDLEAPEVDLPLTDRARLRELERRNRELEREVSFLKNAAAYFAKGPQ
ncbi:transposase [Amycolatopsis dongchuanensis]|uniref:Transposase n=1 Tax=Amycolatopsis dongchuanensis TaxID=1070866 RepID=A0ABP8VS93_9PSEU